MIRVGVLIFVLTILTASAFSQEVQQSDTRSNYKAVKVDSITEWHVLNAWLGGKMDYFGYDVVRIDSNGIAVSHTKKFDSLPVVTLGTWEIINQNMLSVCVAGIQRDFTIYQFRGFYFYLLQDEEKGFLTVVNHFIYQKDKLTLTNKSSIQDFSKTIMKLQKYFHRAV